MNQNVIYVEEIYIEHFKDESEWCDFLEKNPPGEFIHYY